MAEKASATKENRKFDNMATCRICLEHFVEPRLLPCSHTYCFGCIRKAASGTNGDFICPLKDGTTIQQNKINSLRLHPAMVELVKMVSNVTTEYDRRQGNSILDDPEKPPIKSTTPKKSQLEPYNNPIDIPQIFKQNMIFISGLPSNMPNESLFGRLDTVFSAVGEIKIDQQTRQASIDIFREKDNKSQSNVTATITFEQEESAMKAIEKYNGQRVPILNNAQIYVKKSEMTTARPSPRPQNPDSGISTPPKATDIKVWIKLEDRQTTKVIVNRSSDIDDLRNLVLNGNSDRDLYQAYYRNQQLKSGEDVPSDTEDDQPVIFRKKVEPTPIQPLMVDPVTTRRYIPKEFHIVIDNSNVFIGSQNIYNNVTKKFEINPAIRVIVKNLVKVLERNKLETEIKKRVVGGSTPTGNPRVWEEWKSCRYECVVGDRPANSREVFVDNMLHAEIFNIFLSCSNSRIGQVLVLVTGDGNINNGQTSFPIVVERVLRENWSVELWSWKTSLNQRFFDIQKHFATQMTINYLDPYRQGITFEEKAKQN